MQTEEQKGVAWFPTGLTAVYSSLELVNILHHGMWRDELEVWMIARQSHSIQELIFLKRYEGHPDAWYLAVYLITRFTNRPIWMQFFHALVASATTYVIARYSPFTRGEKIMIVFGYFFFFEYAAISREYALTVLGLFIFCAVFRAGPRKNYLLLALILGFVCQTSIYGVILTLSLVIAMVFEAITTPSWRQSIVPIWWQLTSAAVIVMTSIYMSVLHIRPPSDREDITSVNLRIRGLSNGLRMFWMSFVPVPQFTRTFWNSNFIQAPGVSLRFIAFMGMIVFCLSVLFFVRRPTVLFAYVCGAGALYSFTQFVYHGYLRHDGFAFILFLACLWLATCFPEKRFLLKSADQLGNWFAPFLAKTLFILLAIQTAVGLGVSAAAFKIPFSQARDVAGFVRSNKMDQWTMIGDRDYSVSSIAGYLGRDVYYVKGNRQGSFIIWDKKRFFSPAKPVMPFAAKIAAELHHEVLVILSYPPDAFVPGAGEIASFEGAIVPDENYYLYVVQPAQELSTQ